MDAQQREPHLLNLKVMRLSRPTLAKHAFPFVLDPVSGGEGVSEELRSALAGQRSAQALDASFADQPEAGIPARDLGVTPMLMLPSSFGSINLGETFTATLCVSNDAPVPVSGARLVASMQSTSQTLSLGEAGGAKANGDAETQPGLLPPATNLEMMVSCDMRELGLHVLQCQVEYMSSSGPRHFSRSYRFNVTAPLNIKTKTHLPSNPSMTLDPATRDLVFLEVHMQNVSGASMTMEKVELAPVTGMRLVKRTARRERRRSGDKEADEEMPDSLAPSQLFKGAFETLAPGDTRQHLFTLAPIPQPPFPQSSLFPATPTAGSVVPLGRLDLVWRGPYGERGQLLTSMLNRRVAQGALAQPTRTVTALAAQPQARPQSPAVHAMAGQGGLPPPPPSKRSLDADGPWDVALSVLECPRRSMPLRKQMRMKLRVAIGRNGGGVEEPPVHLAIQYLQVVAMPAPLPSPSATGLNTPLSPPSRTATPVQGFQVNVQPPSRIGSPAISRVGSPSPMARAKSAASMRPPSTPPALQRSVTPAPPPPPPFPPKPILLVPAGQLPRETRLTGQVKHIGASLIFLPEVQPQLLEMAAVKRDESPRPSIDGGDPLAPPPPPTRPRNRVEGFVDVDIQLLASKPGLARLGGLRVLRLNSPRDVKQGGEVLREWSTLGDIWVEGW